MIDKTPLSELDAPQLREMVSSLLSTVVAKDREIAFKQAMIDKITHEMAVLKRLKFAARSTPRGSTGTTLTRTCATSSRGYPRSLPVGSTSC